ncbi:hypothetical protein JMJ56_14320 [Belnapia sp. T18]|uniref:Uncharacterized protein n=1 Tax=Belnapia arida TaxID=2804533 RepID=A0ABS1U3E1_9PROT|nr:hypothetical protein [Belnapia arida]MBL6079190.1 hypothetical protein [Belnapia arida]
MHLKTKLLTTTFGLALLALPALAQTGPATMSPPMAPHGAQSLAETGMPHHRHHGMHSERRAERRAMREENRQDAAGLVEEASEALRRGRTAQATDLLERSETRLLTRSIPSDRAGQPMRSPALDSLASARSAIQSRDRAGAQTQMQQAIAILRREGSDMGSGADASTMPMSGQGMSRQGMSGQGMPGQSMQDENMTARGMSGQGTYGRSMMQDGGTAGRSMSRADGILRVQGTGMNAPRDPQTRRDGNPATSHGTTNHGAGGVGAAPTPGTTPTPPVTGSGRSSSGGAVTTGTPSSGNASGATNQSAPTQGSGR